ncbi:hypothetical protein BJV82DRAFT_714147 [Fennellomyces sp. T-0311]|nr:hypothetical protein BJV82DRAFT_714147 [Fennellomyces sp. T-0311]
MPTDDAPREPIIVSVMPRPTSSSSGFFETQFPTTWASHKPTAIDSGGGGTDTSAACIIAFEVVFSVFVFGIVAGCYVFGMRRRRRHRQLEREREQQYAQAQSACSESMLERALDRHERRMLHHLHMLDPSSRQSSSVTTSTNNTTTNLPVPPPYWPPDPTLRLPDQAVARLSQALLMAHMARTPLFHDMNAVPPYPHPTVAPPKYSDIYQQPSRAPSWLSLQTNRPPMEQQQSTLSLPASLFPASNTTQDEPHASRNP